MKTVLLDVLNDDVKVLDIEEDLDTFYDLLNCSCIDIVQRKVNGRIFDIVCDDEGLLKNEFKISAIDSMNNPMLVGNLLFFHNDGEGNLSELSDEDVQCIIGNLGCIGYLPESFNLCVHSCDFV